MAEFNTEAKEPNPQVEVTVNRPSIRIIKGEDSKNPAEVRFLVIFQFPFAGIFPWTPNLEKEATRKQRFQNITLFTPPRLLNRKGVTLYGLEVFNSCNKPDAPGSISLTIATTNPEPHDP